MQTRRAKISLHQAEALAEGRCLLFIQIKWHPERPMESSRLLSTQVSTTQTLRGLQVTVQSMVRGLPKRMHLVLWPAQLPGIKLRAQWRINCRFRVNKQTYEATTYLSSTYGDRVFALRGTSLVLVYRHTLLHPFQYRDTISSTANLMHLNSSVALSSLFYGYGFSWRNC